MVSERSARDVKKGRHRERNHLLL